MNAQKRDTLDVYKRIKRTAYKHKFTTLVFQSVFIDPVPQRYEKKPLSDEQIKKDPNAKFVGKIIRNIIITVYDPFGYSVNDTFSRYINMVQTLGNKVHITSRERIIKNLLLFDEGDSVELIRITESERLLRAMRYINDARIIIKRTKRSDSVDVIVKVLDKWSLDVSLDASTNGGSVRVRDRNFSGLGQTYEQKVGYYKTTGYEYIGNYNFSNIKNTYIAANLYYSTTKEETKTGIALGRTFYSPLTRWAGGAESNKIWGRFHYRDTIDKFETLNYYNGDYWLARSFAFGKKKKTQMNSNIVIGARYAAMRYLQKPSFNIDTGLFNLNSDLYLGSIGYSFRKYYKDMFIYRFGANEDVAEGVLIQFTYGLLQKEIKGQRYYAGFEISKGKHFKKAGYFSGSISYGTLYKNGFESNSTINAGGTYFSNLYQKKKWYFRHFAYYKFTHGLNKEIYEKVTLNSSEMYGFNAGILNGTGKMLLNIEGIVYTPYNVIGFKFAPVLSIGFGMLETPTQKFTNSKIYQAYSLGLLIRNENLLNASFEFTLGFYPEQPDGGRDVFKFNPIGSFRLKVRSFDISKPNMVEFN